MKAGEETGSYSTLYLTRDYVLACNNLQSTEHASPQWPIQLEMQYNMNKKTVANAKIVTTSIEAYIVSIGDIDAGMEIIVPYENRYEM